MVEDSLDNHDYVQESTPDIQSKNISPCFSELTSFGDRPDLLLGVPLVKVLRNGASIFASSHRSAAANRYAVNVARLDCFLSHNWVVWRISKLLALVFHFNSLNAFVVSCSVMAAFLVWQSFAPHPVAFTSIIFGRKVGFLCKLLFVPCFFAASLIVRPLLALLGCKGPMMFVDRACINQDDPTAMSLGLRKLAAFLQCSKRMVVLYTDVYFTKLWTVYEIASFLALHPINRLDLVPVTLAIAFYSCLILSWLGNVWQILVHFYGWPRVVVDVFKLFACMMYTYILRKWVREKHRIKERLTYFDVRCCVCEVAGDRLTIWRRIATLMQSANLCPLGCSLDESLDAFNATVRRELPKAFSTLLGTISFDYKSLVLLSAGMVGLNTLDCVLITVIDRSLRPKLTDATFGLIWTFLYFPLLLACAEILMSIKLNLTGVKEAGWVIIVVLSLGGIAIGADLGIYEITHMAYVSDEVCYAFFATCVGQLLIAGIVGVLFSRKRHHRLRVKAFHDRQGQEILVASMDSRNSTNMDSRNSASMDSRNSSTTSTPDGQGIAMSCWLSRNASTLSTIEPEDDETIGATYVF